MISFNYIRLIENQQSSVFRSSHWMCFVKKMFLKISQNSIRKHPCWSLFFIKKETTQVLLFCEFCRILPNLPNKYVQWEMSRAIIVESHLRGLTFEVSFTEFLNIYWCVKAHFQISRGLPKSLSIRSYLCSWRRACGIWKQEGYQND